MVLAHLAARPVNYLVRSSLFLGGFGGDSQVRCCTKGFIILKCAFAPGFKYKPNLSSCSAEGMQQQIWEAFLPISEAVTLQQARDLSSQCLHRQMENTAAKREATSHQNLLWLNKNQRTSIRCFRLDNWADSTKCFSPDI